MATPRKKKSAAPKAKKVVKPAKPAKTLTLTDKFINGIINGDTPLTHDQLELLQRAVLVADGDEPAAAEVESNAVSISESPRVWKSSDPVKQAERSVTNLLSDDAADCCELSVYSVGSLLTYVESEFNQLTGALSHTEDMLYPVLNTDVLGIPTEFAETPDNVASNNRTLIRLLNNIRKLRGEVYSLTHRISL